MSANPDYYSQLPSPRLASFDEVLDVWDQWDSFGTDRVGMRALCLEDRYYLLVKVLNRHDLLHPWLYDRCREVENDPDGYLDLWSRFHYKSTIITYAGVIQEVLRDPEITVGIFSHTAPTAKAFLKQIRNEFEGNAALKALFPDILWQSPTYQADSWSLDAGITVKRKSNPKEATIEAHGLVDGMPTSRHYRLRVYDDVVVRESVTTPEQIMKTTEAWELSAALGTEDGRKWHIGTRWSYADTYRTIIERGAVKVRLYPSTEDGTWDGDPVYWTPEFNAQMKLEMGEQSYSCQCLQNPLTGRNREFDLADVQEYEVRPATLNVYVLVDPARSRKKGSANTAVAVIGVDYAMNKYLLDGFDHKMDLMERWQRTAQMYVRWKNMPGVQNVRVGYEAYGAQADLDYFKEQMKIKGNPRFDIEELLWPREGPGAKTDRVQRLGPDLRSHKFFVPYPTDADNFTSIQRMMIAQGYQYRVAAQIRRKDGHDQAYDLTENLKSQIHDFPFTPLVDLIDAVSRIYDMEPRAPASQEVKYAEPEFV